MSTSTARRNNMKISVEITESQFEKFQKKAKHLGILPKDIIKATLSNMLNYDDELFYSASEYVLNKNKELYQRVS